MTDAELLVLIRDGDSQAATTFAQRHWGWARVYASRLGAGDEARDVAQDVLSKMIFGPPIELRTPSARPYMARAISNAIVSAGRKRPPAASITGESGLLKFADDGTSPSAGAARREFWHAARQALEELPTAQRVAVVLRNIRGLTFPEIALITGRPADTMRRSHDRATKRLRQKLSRFFCSETARKFVLLE
ncbi:RNA polymerase sigma factor [Enhygromyxa salina]|uniref:ECF RNA polymerase sigma factor SigW n=1 Tax=Enhygromyxa salina TaxID=215803 RepID=A0A2S9YV35_9BACT|nr:RNA polymerase sigma factor [Enhygromyxa salina]PRQ08967.1 ECF RNA polymerase sigma factor SigW [Enhygromyxa salina]